MSINKKAAKLTNGDFLEHLVHAFDSVFKKWILLFFVYVFKVSSYFYKRLLLQNDSIEMNQELSS